MHPFQPNASTPLFLKVCATNPKKTIILIKTDLVKFPQNTKWKFIDIMYIKTSKLHKMIWLKKTGV
jgi:hypothetical protein